MNEETKKPNFIVRFLKTLSFKTILIIIVTAIIVATFTFGLTNGFFSNGTVTKMGFEDIGELATQAAYCTVLNNIDDPRKFFWGGEIPLTRSRFIYSRQYVVKAGFDFGEIKYYIDETCVSVYLPAVRILSQTAIPNSLKVYIEEENIFSPVTLNEQNESEQARLKEAVQSAIVSGLYENAIANAKTILTGFISQHYSPDEFEFKFFDKETGKEI
jgi:hypothetical protein